MLKKLLIAMSGALVLSGCSLGGVTTPKSGSQDSATSPETGAFATKAEPGSLWKTGDGGKTFAVKSKVDEKQSITKADILSIAYHPQKPQVLYVGTVENGIFKTENGG